MKRLGESTEQGGYRGHSSGAARALQVDPTLLPLIAAAIAAVVLFWGTVAHASCEVNRTEIVGQVPDVFFTAGVAAEKTISVTYRTLSDPKYNTCSFGARVWRTGVSVRGLGGVVAPPAAAVSVGSIGLTAGTTRKSLAIKVAAYAPAGMALVELLDESSDGRWDDARIVGAVKVYITPSTFKTSFVTTATTANTSGNFTSIDHPFTNGNPYARLLVTPNLNPSGKWGGVYNNHPIGVWYNTLSSKWAVFNQDLAPIPRGAAFNVRIEGDMQTGAPIQTATVGNTSFQSTFITNDVTNRNPGAFIMLTPVWNPPGSSGMYNNHNTGVWYDTRPGKWAIFNQDLAAMPSGASFVMRLIGIAGDPSSGAFVHTVTSASKPSAGANYSWIDSPLTNGNPGAIILVTANFNPSGSSGTSVTSPIGVGYDSYHSKWSIFSQNQSAMPVGASFNVLVPVAPVH